MNSAAFEAELRREGFDIVHGEAEPGPPAPMHVHDFDLHFLVLDGAFTLVTGNERRLHNPGDVCVVPAGVMHNEIVEKKMRYVAGQRPVKAATTNDGAAFEAELQDQGYRIVKGEFRPPPDSEEHMHDYDVRFMVLAGEITIIRDFDRHTYKSGDTCFVPAGTNHAERVGAETVRYIAGVRAPKASEAIAG